MRIAAQLKLIKEGLGTWAKDNAAKLHIVADPVSLILQIQQGPASARACVMFHGEDKRGEYEESGMVDRSFWVVVSRSSGLKIEPGDALVEESAGGKALFELVDDCREACRALVFEPETTEGSIDFKSIAPFKIEGVTTDAYQIVFAIGTQLPAVAEEEETAT